MADWSIKGSQDYWHRTAHTHAAWCVLPAACWGTPTEINYMSTTNVQRTLSPVRPINRLKREEKKEEASTLVIYTSVEHHVTPVFVLRSVFYIIVYYYCIWKFQHNNYRLRTGTTGIVRSQFLFTPYLAFLTFPFLRHSLVTYKGSSYRRHFWSPDILHISFVNTAFHDS